MLVFRGERKRLVLNKTNAVVLAAMYDRDSELWKGKEITLMKRLITTSDGQLAMIRIVRPARAPGARRYSRPASGHAEPGWGIVSDLFAKVRRAFGDYAVDKSLLQAAEVSKLPGFVAEYLMTEFSMKYRGRLAGEAQGVHRGALLRGQREGVLEAPARRGEEDIDSGRAQGMGR
ncbi:MAG: hypothetical protein ACP5G6_04320, partial [Conexivisphaera sp.]